ncbi:AraC family transcriptional regulator [Vibrio sp. F74]|uniref:AraC family transcriptional regulator n=1 Tax=Vibrio sp. F74 TaxID=700020 RepID=UPI0035F5C378
MNYSIQFENIAHPYITISSRRKTLKYSLMTVTQGTILIKVGKNEYAVEPGQYFWIPADCLVSTTFFPLSNVSTIAFSQRLADSFTNKVGFVEASDITENAFSLLMDSSLDNDYHQVLLQVVRHEVKNTKPQLLMNQLSQKFNAWAPNNNAGLDAEIHFSLKLREARKRVLSGKKPEQVALELFDVSQQEFAGLCEFGFGASL